MNTIHRIGLLLLASCVFPASVCAADWPMYQGDAERSAITGDRVRLPLVQSWVYQPARPPQPAWPDPIKEPQRLDFDHAFQPVVAGGIVYFGSSADDTLRALDAQTGKLLWRFTCAGPIRFAPAVANGKVYLAADDGFLYCLDAKSAAVHWKFQAAPKTDLVLGNGRLISRWPLRSGVLVAGDDVFVTAGMWPSEGVFVYALDAQTGRVRWCNDTSGVTFRPQPHKSAYALTGVAPQGYLLATDRLLVVPSGRSAPAVFDRNTGELAYYHPEKSQHYGGCWAAIAGERLFSGGLVFDLAKGELIDYPSSAPSWAKSAPVSDGDQVPGPLTERRQVLGYRGQRLIVDKQRVLGDRQGESLALAGTLLFEGSDKKIQAFDIVRDEHKPVWEAEVAGCVRALAIAHGRLYAGTTLGAIHCFATDKPENGSLRQREETGTNVELANPELEAILKLPAGAPRKGYALIVGEPNTRLAEALAAKSEFHIILLAKSDAVATMRQQLCQAGKYGPIVVLDEQRLSDSALIPYFANLVTIRGDLPPDLARKVLEAVRPAGGLLCLLDTAKKNWQVHLENGDGPYSALQEGGGILWSVRGRLPGAFDWNSKESCDQRVRWPLELAWFGGPGPARMADRHRRIASPAIANGRYFVVGLRHVIAVDAYNGTELWSFECGPPLPGPLWKQESIIAGLTADDQHVYVDAGKGWIQLDALTGQTKRMVQGPPENLGPWGRLPRADDRAELRYRQHALTGKVVPLSYYRWYGCNRMLSSAGVDVFRSGTVGIYDHNDDSGLRNFGGIRPSCSQSYNAAFGILFLSDGASGCVCGYNFQTSLALVPSARRRHEDWATYYDQPLVGLLRQAAINLGAPGDRRDGARTLWLGFPRSAEERMLQVPVTAAVDPGMGPYRFNADRRVIEGTDRPWLYSSGYRGLRRLTISLHGGSAVLSKTASKAPTLDGKLEPHEWPAAPQMVMRPGQAPWHFDRQFSVRLNPEAKVFVSHDAENLYVACQLPAEVDRLGKQRPWLATLKGADAPVWADDSWELFLSDAAEQHVVHLGVSASGARFDALASAGKPENPKWNGAWSSNALATDKALTIELAVPFKTLQAAVLKKDGLSVNSLVNVNRSSISHSYLGPAGRKRCDNFVPLGLDKPPVYPERSFRIALHFCEPDGAKPGERVFDVKLQGKTVLDGFDIAREAGSDRALIRTFDNVRASGEIVVELVPRTKQSTPRSAPVLNAVEVKEQR